MLSIIGEILIEIGKRILVRTQSLVGPPESISSSQLSESLEVDDIERTEHKHYDLDVVT